MTDALSPAELDALAVRIEAWMAEQAAENPAVDAVVRDEESGERRWFVRLLGEEKSIFSVWFHLQQRNLHVETYLMPAPEENHAALFEHLLRRNRGIEPFSLVIGDEDGVFLSTVVPNRWVNEDELDRLLGSAFEYTERFFRPAMRLGFASKFR